MRAFILALFLLFSWSSQAAPQTLRLLTIGNSFADNALKYLPQIAEAAGHQLIVGRANLGGCTLERHWRHAAAYDKDPGGKEGSPYGGGKQSLHGLLTKEPWDVVTLQQVSIKSHDPATYQPYADDLYARVRRLAPQARILAHQIWAYRVDDPRFVPANKGKEPHTHQEMYSQVRAAYHQLAHHLKIGILPSGDAMYLADTDAKWGYRPDSSFDRSLAQYPQLPDQSHSLHRGWYWKKDGNGNQVLGMDGHHANAAGEYLIGCVWFEVLFGENVENNTFTPKPLDAAYASFLRRTAHQACEALKAGQPVER